MVDVRGGDGRESERKSSPVGILGSQVRCFLQVRLSLVQIVGTTRGEILALLDTNVPPLMVDDG